MQRKLTVILASVVLLIALVSIVRWSRPLMPQISPAPFAAFGQVVADETLKVMAGHGRIVVVINDQQQRSDNPAHAELERFQTGIKKHDAVSLMATEVVPSDPTELVIGAGCSATQLQAILTKYAAADAIVFLIGLPEWGVLQARGIALQPGSAKIVVAVEGAIPTKGVYGGYFDRGVLSLLIGIRLGSAGAVTSNISREWLRTHCQIYTPQNSDTLPE